MSETQPTQSDQQLHEARFRKLSSIRAALESAYTTRRLLAAGTMLLVLGWYTKDYAMLKQLLTRGGIDYSTIYLIGVAGMGIGASFVSFAAITPIVGRRQKEYIAADERPRG